MQEPRSGRMVCDWVGWVDGEMQSGQLFMPWGGGLWKRPAAATLSSSHHRVCATTSTKARASPKRMHIAIHKRLARHSDALSMWPGIDAQYHCPNHRLRSKQGV